MRQPLAFLILALAAAPGWTQTKVDQRRTAEPDGLVAIHNAAGSIRVAWLTAPWKLALPAATTCQPSGNL